ncbi:MAG: methyltransferase domain-containing protein [Candidatus Campbellbacteria bacterium]|nr:methyltransferase domain-containing protein [Candidatus Campbellbacteria bacterium]
MNNHPLENIKQAGIKSGSIVIDFGAGLGEYTNEVSKVIGENGKVYALDIQKDLVQSLKERMREKGRENAVFIWGNLEKERSTGMEANCADFVIMANVLFQINNKDIAIKEAKRVLKQGGILLFIDWLDSFDGLGPSPDMIIKEEDVRDWVSNADFIIVRPIKTGEHHFGFIAEKK